MAEQRLTRRERQALTRQRLIEVAAEELRAGGYRGTSLERVAERAGFSKGAVYSNFASKEELVLAVLDQRFLHQLDSLRDDLQAAPETIEARLATFSSWWADLIRDQASGSLIFELAAQSRDNAEVLAQMRQREINIVTYVAEIIGQELDRFELELPLAPETLATVLVSLGSGLSFSAMLDPNTPVDVLSDVARLLFLGRP